MSLKSHIMHVFYAQRAKQVGHLLEDTSVNLKVPDGTLEED